MLRQELPLYPWPNHRWAMPRYLAQSPLEASGPDDHNNGLRTQLIQQSPHRPCLALAGITGACASSMACLAAANAMSRAQISTG
jgi:hypothetical protein